MNTGIHQATKELMMPKPSVKAITIFIQIRPEIFGIQAMVCADNARFGVADERMDPFEGLPQIHLIRFLGLMLAIRDGMIRGKGVGLEDTPFRCGLLQRLLEGVTFQIGERAHLCKAGMLILSDGQCHQHRRLVGPPSPFLADGRGAKVRVIDFNDASQGILGIPLGHGEPDLVQHPPGSGIRHGKFLAESQGRDPAFIFGDQKQHPEPDMEGDLGFVKQGPRGDRGLRMTVRTLIDRPGRNHRIRGGLTAGANKTIGPTHLKKMGPTGGLVGKLGLKFI